MLKESQIPQYAFFLAVSGGRLFFLVFRSVGNASVYPIGQKKQAERQDGGNKCRQQDIQPS